MRGENRTPVNDVAGRCLATGLLALIINLFLMSLSDKISIITPFFLKIEREYLIVLSESFVLFCFPSKKKICVHYQRELLVSFSLILELQRLFFEIVMFGLFKKSLNKLSYRQD